MKSIRLSLMVYFLGLLAVALLTASLLVYRNAQQTLGAKQRAMAQLIEAQYRDRCREEERRLDADLLSQAQMLARLVQIQFEHYRTDLIQPSLMLGVLSCSVGPNGHLLMPTWIAEGARTWTDRPGPQRLERPSDLYLAFRHHLPPRLHQQQLKFDFMDLPSDAQSGDYFFQIDSPPSKSYYSPSLGDRSFDLNVSVFNPEEVVNWIFDTTVLAPNVPVRRVVLKASGVARGFPRPSRRPPFSPAASPPAVSPTSPPPPPRSSRGPTIYVHCATRTDRLEAALAAFLRQHDDEMQAVEAETHDSLRDLRLWLLGISLAVFTATAVGSFWLVRLGLSPLCRLSDAVSQVSARDFRLPLDKRPLPLELRPIAERLTNTLDLLKRAFAREKQAAADISHELRTPLAALLTSAEFALRKPRSPEQYRELFGDCLTSAQQMNQIVERLLTLARLDAGVDRLRVQEVDVAGLAEQCAAVVRPLAEARGLSLLIKKTPAGINGNGEGACLMETDPDKLREIVTNLLHNAIQYNREGGSVTVRVERHNGTLEVEVEDSGIGIAAGQREHIFERFYRVDPSRGSDDLHAGLGLAIVKEYVDLMGGSINVESTEGQGSTFRIRLPIR